MSCSITKSVSVLTFLCPIFYRCNSHSFDFMSSVIPLNKNVGSMKAYELKFIVCQSFPKVYSLLKEIKNGKIKVFSSFPSG